ncbi:MAG: DNA polymerase III subunit beta [Spirochaetales bacterium]
MKFTCEKNALLKEIGIAQEIISSKSTLSILSNVLLEAQEGKLTLRATDLKVAFETSIPVEVSVPGNTTVFCDKFLGILRTLPEGDIEFEEKEGGTFLIRPVFKKIDFRLKTISADKYPELPSLSEEHYFSFPQKDFKEMIQQTIFAVSEDETRYYMNGVCMEKGEDQLVMVATDGRRLSYISKPSPQPIPDFSQVIIPPKVLTLVQRLASGEGMLSLAVSDKNVFLTFDNQKLSSALIEGQFPNYQRVIPAEQLHKVKVGIPELLEALKRVSLMVEQKSKRIYLELSEGRMVLSSEESELGVAKEELVCEYEGPETVIALNYLYLLEPLRVMDGSYVFIEYTEPNRALTLRPAENTEYFHIVMPMQLD